MSDNYDYLVNDEDRGVLQNLTKMGEHLKALKLKMIEAEAAAKEAKKEYEYYASSVLPMEMYNAGVTELTLASGGKMTYERKFHCQPNKNDEDKQIMAEWLREHGGAYIIKESAKVDGAQLDKLRAADIPYAEISDINTNSLKAFLKDKLGVGEGTAQIQMQDIPACMHFQEVGFVDIEV